MATNHFTHASVLALNAVLVESPESLTTGAFAEITSSIIVQGIASSQPFVADNCVLAAGKYLLTESSDKSFDSTKPIFEDLGLFLDDVEDGQEGCFRGELDGDDHVAHGSEDGRHDGRQVGTHDVVVLAGNGADHDE